jgi:acyl-CoA reductase-like NAD-dependent aldehyde dehydrogenase
MDMLIGGTWRQAMSGLAEDVTSPFDGAPVGTVPVAGVADVRAALDAAQHGALAWRRTPAHERMRVLLRAADLADERAEATAQIISAESGKTITEARANGTPYGLGAGIFTADVSGAVRAIREIDAGTVHINWTPLWRADLMPYGGLKASGIGKEGPRSAVAEMTDVKTVVLHGRPW